MKKPLAIVAAGALLATPLALVVSSAASADTARNGAIAGGGRYELNVDREDGGFEISGDLDNVAPGSTWKVVLRHDGKKVLNQRLVADNEGDLDVQRYRPDTAGKDVFTFVATRVGGEGKVRTTLTR